MTVASPPPRTPIPGGSPAPATPDPAALIEEARQRARKRRRTGTALVVLLVLLGGAIFLGATGRPGETSGDSAGARPLTGAPEPGLIAYATGRGELFVVSANGSERRKLTTCRTEEPRASCVIAQFAWSPDGRSLAFVSGTPHMSRPSEMSLRVIGVDGTDERLLASCAARAPGRPDPADCGWGYRALVSWSPDSSRVAFSRGLGIAVATLATGAIRSITRCPGQCADGAPAWSPTGQRIAFVRNDAIFTVRPDGSRLTRLAAGLASSLAWSPGGASFVFDSPAGISTINDDGTGEKSLVLWRSFGAGPGLPSWSPDGRRIAYFQTPGKPGKFRSEVWVMNADGTGRTRLYEGVCCVGTWARPVWSPSGREIAFADTSYDGELAGGTFSVRVADRHLQRLAPAEAAPDLVAWQPVAGP